MRNEVCDITGNCYVPSCERIYVGARYVPKVEGFWEIGREYENLSIVIEPTTNNGFTSKKYVPVGVALTDTEYWVQTSNYDGVVGQLEDKFNAFVLFVNDQFALFNSDIIAAKKLGTEAKDGLNEMKGQQKIINELHESKITENTARITALENKNTSLGLRIGDLEKLTTSYRKSGKANFVVGESDYHEGVTKVSVIMKEGSPATSISMFTGYFIVLDIGHYIFNDTLTLTTSGTPSAIKSKLVNVVNNKINVRVDFNSEISHEMYVKLERVM